MLDKAEAQKGVDVFLVLYKNRQVITSMGGQACYN